MGYGLGKGIFLNVSLLSCIHVKEVSIFQRISFIGIKGNVSLYELNTEEVVKMLKGQLMPKPSLLSVLASVLAITFVGSRKLSKNWLKSKFRVRRRVVYES